MLIQYSSTGTTCSGVGPESSKNIVIRLKFRVNAAAPHLYLFKPRPTDPTTSDAAQWGTGRGSKEVGDKHLSMVAKAYGTKQGAREWYQKLLSIFVSLGYKICSVDEAVFYK